MLHDTKIRIKHLEESKRKLASELDNANARIEYLEEHISKIQLIVGECFFDYEKEIAACICENQKGCD